MADTRVLEALALVVWRFKSSSEHQAIMEKMEDSQCWGYTPELCVLVTFGFESR